MATPLSRALRNAGVLPGGRPMIQIEKVLRRPGAASHFPKTGFFL
jgi:hypothetical protein